MNDWAVAALLLEGLLAIVTAVWVVASIRGTTQNLRQTIDTLSRSVMKLETAIGTIESRQVDHEVRLALLERGVVRSNDPLRPDGG